MTFSCPSKCKHCAYKAGPEVTGLMKEAEGWLKELVGIQPLQSVLVHGGEPFIYYSQLLSFIKRAKEWEIPRRYIITNGYWAETETIAKKKLEELMKAGLTHITFSVDAFHQEYISFTLVETGIKVATSLNFEKIFVDSYLLDQSNPDNAYDSITRKLIGKLSVFENKVEFSSHPLHFWGRAVDVLAREIDSGKKSGIPKGPCQPPYWIGDDMRNPKTIRDRIPEKNTIPFVRFPCRKCPDPGINQETKNIKIGFISFCPIVLNKILRRHSLQLYTITRKKLSRKGKKESRTCQFYLENI